MSKREIIEKIAKERWVEKIARHFKTFARADLCQYAYLYLLTKVDDDKLIELYQNNHLKQYITGLLYRQVVSDHSHYIKTYGKRNLSIDEDAFDNHPHSQNIYEIAYDDAPPHQLEDDFDAYYSQLPESEQDMLWLFLQPLNERKEDIDIWCKRYGISYRMYLQRSVKLKNKIRNYYGKETKRRNYPQHRHTRNRKVEIYDKSDKLLVVADSVEYAYKWVLEQNTYITKDMIYKVLNGKRLSAKGYKFLYVN